MTEILEQYNIDLDGETTSDAERSLEQRLSAVNWDFPERISHSDIEGIHPYPAKFIAEIPRTLLSRISVKPDTAVLDPFCGSGTTLVECQRLGINTIGIDLNPIACLITRIKTSTRPSNLIVHAIDVVKKAEKQPAATVPEIPNLDHWFEQAIQQKLASLILAIKSAPVDVHDCLRLALSRIIVRVSNQESDTRYAAIAKKVTPKNVSDLFLRAVESIDTALRARRYPLTAAQVIEGNTLNITSAQLTQPVSLVITSPPYPNAYEYWLYHKYRMWWLGFDPLGVKEQEIGARAHFFKKNHHTAEDFNRQMRQTFALLHKVVVPGGHVCFVVGRSRIHGEIIDNATTIKEEGGAFGFQLIFQTQRVLSAHRKSFNLNHANIKTETVLVLRNKED